MIEAKRDPIIIKIDNLDKNNPKTFLGDKLQEKNVL